MADAPKLLGTDTLRTAYPKINSAIDNANEAINKHAATDAKADQAISTSNTAKSTAETALAASENTQTQLDTIVINGDSSVEAAQARVDANGNTYTTLQERLNSSDTLLAENVKKLQNTENYNGGIFSIIDDDGLSKFMQRWKPIADAQGIKISLAVHSAAVGVSGFLTLAELKQLKSEGYDILSHAKNAIDLNTATLQEIETYWVDAKNYLINNELGDDLALVYPGGLFNISSQDKAVKVKELTRKHYKYGIDALASTSAVNQLPVDSYEVLRRVFNPATDTLNTIKSNIDDAFTNKKWFILLTHIGNDAQWVDNTSPNTLNSIIDYVQGLGMPILSFRDAEKLVGNGISLGDSRTNNYNFVSKNGATWAKSSRGSSSSDAIVLPMSVSSMNALITEYPSGKMTSMQISNVQDTFLSAGGVMTVYRGDSQFSYALYYPAQSNKIYKRYYNDNTSTWGTWNLVSEKEVLVTTYTHTSNKEVAVSAVDVATNTFTSVGHGLANGDKVFPVMNVNAGSIYPVDKYPGGITYSGGYFVINASADTFQLSTTSGGASITLTSNANMDLTKWHFEANPPDGFNILSLPPSAKYKLKVNGKNLWKSSAMYFKPNGIGSASEWIAQGGTTYSNIITSAYADMMIDLEILFDYTKFLTMKTKGFTLMSNNATSNTMTAIDKMYVSPKYNAGLITNFQMTSWFPANGTVIEVYAVA